MFLLDSLLQRQEKKVFRFHYLRNCCQTIFLLFAWFCTNKLKQWQERDSPSFRPISYPPKLLMSPVINYEEIMGTIKWKSNEVIDSWTKRFCRFHVKHMYRQNKAEVLHAIPNTESTYLMVFVAKGMSHLNLLSISALTREIGNCSNQKVLAEIIRCKSIHNKKQFRLWTACSFKPLACNRERSAFLTPLGRAWYNASRTLGSRVPGREAWKTHEQNKATKKRQLQSLSEGPNKCKNQEGKLTKTYDCIDLSNYVGIV